MVLYSLGSFDSLGLHVLLWDGFARFVLSCVGHARVLIRLDLLSLVLLGLAGLFLFAVFGYGHTLEIGLVTNYTSSSIGSGFGALGKWIL